MRLKHHLLRRTGVGEECRDKGRDIMTSHKQAQAIQRFFLTLTFLSKMDCPMTGEKDMSFKQVIRIINADTHVFEMHETREGKSERKTMEITYTRK